jgi:hypothetical protein
MKIRILTTVSVAALLQCAVAGAMSVNVSMPGAINPFTNYEKTYQDKSGAACTFRFSQPGDGLSYLATNQKCPSFVTEDLVFKDAQRSIDNKGQGRKPARGGAADLAGYPVQFCVDGDLATYFFADTQSSEMPGWKLAYQDKNNSGRLERLGFWQVAMQGEVILTTGGVSTVIPASGTRPCANTKDR